ncbi:KAD4 kinase, partial [Atractosteus spatula]|nr:KAD4 kinase [Atractosteus spatula]
MANKLFRAIIMGPPGSGKGTISQRIAQRFGLQHLSSGDFLRENIAASTEAGILAQKYIEKGLLVPDQVITRLVLTKLERMTRHSWLLDGITLPLQTLEPQLLKFHIKLYCGFILADVVLENVRSSQLPWILNSLCSISQGIDDISGEPLIQRDDDKPEAVMARLRHYKDIAKPVIDLYNDTLTFVPNVTKTKGVLHSFSGTETDKIWPYIYSLLSSKIPPVHPDEQQALSLSGRDQ